MKSNFPRELARRFEQAVAEGQVAQGSIVTSAEMAKRFRTTPQEIEAVLRACYRKGFVQPRERDFQILEIIKPTMDSLFQHTAKSGMSPSSDVRAVTTVPAGQAASEKLLVPLGSPVYRLERTRIVNGETVANQVNLIPYEICPGLEEDDMTHHSFQKLLETKYRVVFAEMREKIFMAAASQSDRDILGLGSGEDVLVIDRVAVGKTNCPLVWADIHIRPDCYHYVAGLWPGAADLVKSRNAK